MSQKLLKNIEFELSKNDINRAIREVRHFQEELQRQCLELVRALTETGTEVAKMQVASMDAVDTGELENDIAGVFFPEERIGVVFSPTPHALFVEYGTGIVGAGTYPSDGETPQGWEYDYNHHGNAGWVYKNKNDGKFYWTRGYIARPFMLNTLRWLEEHAETEAGKIWAEM